MAKTDNSYKKQIDLLINKSDKSNKNASNIQC